MVSKWVFNIRGMGSMDFMDIHQQRFQELVDLGQLVIGVSWDFMVITVGI